jgi:uncharacterized membrane protein YkoI
MNSSRKLLLSGALAGTALAGGALIANLANAASDGTTSAPNATTATTVAPSQSGSETPAAPNDSGSQTPPADDGQRDHTPDWSKGGHQANGKTETVLTGDAKTKAIAAAEAAVPGATAQRAETDAEGATYEVHMTKSDGSVVTVKLDSNFKVTDTIDGMG